MASIPKPNTQKTPEAPKAPPVVETPLVVETPKPRVDVSTLSRVVKVKHKVGGKELSVSRGYYEKHSHKLDLVK